MGAGRSITWSRDANVLEIVSLASMHQSNPPCKKWDVL